MNRALIERYVETALANGLDGIVITEHLFRFREAFDLLRGWWDADPNPRLASMVAAYWQDHVSLRLDEYVALIEAAKSAGLPVFLGMEMDWLSGKAEVLRGILAPYAWDLVLGSVHWIGAFAIDDEAMLDQWECRETDQILVEYGQLLRELADSGLVDVLAHADLPKIFGYKPTSFVPLHQQIVAAAVRGGCAIEINTKGLLVPAAELYPAPDVLHAAYAAGVPVTLASDAHRPDRLGQSFDRAIVAAKQAGYQGYVRHVGHQRVFEPFTAS